MKKNLRIVSVAAALLAVAPVAATTVSTAPTATVQAADTTPTLKGTIILDRDANTQFSVKLTNNQKDAILQLVGENNAKASDMKDIHVVSATGQNDDGVFQQTVQFTVNSKTYTVILNAKFASQQGTPYFYNKDTNTVIDNGSTVKLNDIANGFTSQSLLNEINNHYAWKTSDAKGSNADMTTTASDVESQLVAQGLKRASNGSFDYPANGFNLKLTAKSENGNTASITVRINADVNYNAPVFVVTEDGKSNLYYNEADATNNLINGTKDNPVIKDNKLNTKYIESTVTAYVQSAYQNSYDKTVKDVEAHQQKISSSNVKFDYSKVNTSVAGIYPVVVTATSPAGFTSKMTLYVVVNGPVEKAPQEYVANDGVKVYNINGNVVSEDTNAKTLAKGAAVYTFGKVTVNGVEYTRINIQDSNEFVKSSDLTATAPNTTVESTSKTVMHNAYYYGKAYYEVVENGKLSGKYINADNIDGTKRTLKHNAYVYASSKKRANKKGDTVTTYGASYTFKNGKQYYKIGNDTAKTYVKASNFY